MLLPLRYTIIVPLLRRAAPLQFGFEAQGKSLGIEGAFTPAVAEVAIALSGGCDPELAGRASRIRDELAREEGRFRITLAAGEKALNDSLEVTPSPPALSDDLIKERCDNALGIQIRLLGESNTACGEGSSTACGEGSSTACGEGSSIACGEATRCGHTCVAGYTGGCCHARKCGRIIQYMLKK